MDRWYRAFFLDIHYRTLQIFPVFQRAVSLYDIKSFSHVLVVQTGPYHRSARDRKSGGEGGGGVVPVEVVGGRSV